ncbi:protein NRT1/ PTR FAMILY 8.1 [Physcomitrium patens]|uniref:Uncharacterized protein n=1 Tax=Physcomitrium patens TaxID=3218 RepID=A9SG37_PHYPA|nr:protein NRT1/ PTR FAMILY 8.1-like [Physcomitrium patens]PNR51176.1 hypothetical protein PHYPA_010362 [Physcomitrium patens]|eukprot:XP_024380518.1 protein NRT1/ PTR FAMILY 8.1-like [Physcomitrella patens]
MATEDRLTLPWSNGEKLKDAVSSMEREQLDDSQQVSPESTSSRKFGGWKTSPYILGNHALTTIAYYGVATNLVLYLTQILHEGNSSAAANYSNWLGTSYLTSLIGAFLGDAYWGRYRTAIIFSAINLSGMVILTLSVTLPYLRPPPCPAAMAAIHECPEPSVQQIGVFYFAIYSIALGAGGFQPCLSALGADQFDELDPKESKQQKVFFSVYYLCLCAAALVSGSVIVYIEANVGWDWGFGISLGALVVGNFVLVLGSRLYRQHPPAGNPLARIAQVVVASIRKWQVVAPKDDTLLYEVEDSDTSAIQGTRKIKRSHEFMFLDKAATASEAEKQAAPGSFSPWRLVTVTQVEEVKFILRILPIWFCSIIFSAIYTQMLTLFIVQGATMDTRIGRFNVPPASISLFDFISVLSWAPIYEWVLVPMARSYSGNERGFTGLQRMGIGLAVMTVAMVAAATIEIARLKTARIHGLLDAVDVPVPMSIFWQVPQYSLVGASEVFTYIGQLEFFYEQSPDGIRGLGSALALTTFGLGNFLSSILVTGVTKITSTGGSPGWIPAKNLNRGHLDYFYWFLAGLSTLNLALYIKCAQWYRITSAQLTIPSGTCMSPTGCAEHKSFHDQETANL